MMLLGPLRPIRHFARLLLAVAALLHLPGVAAIAEDAEPPSAARPSFLVLVADDVSWKDFGCYGHPSTGTPHIDRLAAAGLRFENAFLTTSQCSPTRISVLTGKYPHATGAEDLHTPLPEGEVFVSTLLRQAGYFTGHMQKTHYGPNGERQFEWYSKSLDDFPRFLDAAGERPFFLWVGFHDAHRPYEPGAIAQPHDPAEVVVPPTLADTPETRADLALYYDEVARMDSNIGRMIGELARRDRLDDTCVVFFSDNGRPFPRAKGTLYDDGIGTPLIFHWPEVIRAGSVTSGLASVIDLAPTFCELAGAPIPAEMQGESMAARLRDPALPGRSYVFSERNWHNCDEHMRSVRTERFKLIRNSYVELPFGSPADVSRSPSWQSLKRLQQAGKLSPAQSALFRAPRPEFELYDLAADPDELHNLADDPRYRSTRDELAAVLEAWQAETGDFPPDRRRRDDNTDRVTGVKHTRSVPPLRP